MLQQASRRIGQAALMAILIAVSAWVLADEKSSVAPQRKNSNPARTSGVIVKVEPVEQSDQASKRIWRVTVNTDVVWRDFVRDQAVDPSKAARTGTERAAAKGKKSVAAEGHPRAEAMSATVNLNPKTEITERYRSSTDELSEGAATPENASRVEDAIDTSSDTKTGQAADGKNARRQALKARVLEPTELKPGLWIDVEYQGDQVRRVMVIRPVGGPDTSPKKENEPATRKANPAH